MSISGVAHDYLTESSMGSCLVIVHFVFRAHDCFPLWPLNETTDDPAKLARYLFRDGG